MASIVDRLTQRLSRLWSGEETYEVGERVELHSLKEDKDINGKFGTVTQLLHTRYVVRLDKDSDVEEEQPFEEQPFDAANLLTQRTFCRFAGL